MGQIAEMDQIIKDLRNAAAAVEDAAGWLTEIFEKDDDRQSEPVKPALTLEDVRAVLAEKSRSGYTAQVRELLCKYGASKLSEVDPQNYEALLRDAEVMGNAT